MTEHKWEAYIDEESPLVIPRDVYELVMATGEKEECLTLLSFYLTKSMWQFAGGEVQMSVDEVATQLNWSAAKVRRAKGILKGIGIMREKSGRAWTGVEIIMEVKEGQAVTRKRRAVGDFLNMFPRDWVLHEAFAGTWQKWEEVRRIDQRKPLTKRAVETQMELLLQYSPDEAVQIIKNSINSGWTGLFKLKTFGNKPSANQEPEPANPQAQAIIDTIEVIRGHQLTDGEAKIAVQVEERVRRGYEAVQKAGETGSGQSEDISAADVLLHYYPTLNRLVASLSVFLHDQYPGFKDLSPSMLLNGKVWNRWVSSIEDELGGIHLRRWFV